MANPELLTAQEKYGFNRLVEAYDAAGAAGDADGQVRIFRQCYSDLVARPRNKANQEFFRRIGQIEDPIAVAPVPGPNEERIIAPMNEDVVKEQMTVTALTDAYAAVASAESPFKAYAALKNVPGYKGASLGVTLNTAIREIGGLNANNEQWTVADAIDYWRYAITVAIPDPSDPTKVLVGLNEKGMANRSWEQVVALGKQMFVRDFTTGPHARPENAADAEYIWNVAIRMIITTNEQGKWGLDAKSSGAQEWMQQVARLDFIIKDIAGKDKNASRYVAEQSSELPIICGGFLSDRLANLTGKQKFETRKLYGKNIREFVRAVNAGNVNLSADDLRAADFDTDLDLPTYYVLLAHSVFAGLVESKFLENFVANPGAALTELASKKPGKFLNRLDDDGRNNLIEKFIEIAVGWNRRRPGLGGFSPLAKSIAAEEGRTDVAPIGENEIKDFITRNNKWATLFDETARKKKIDDVVNHFRRAQGLVVAPAGRVAGVGLGIVGGASEAIFKRARGGK